MDFSDIILIIWIKLCLLSPIGVSYDSLEGYL